jgi:hypothetical protein
MRETLRLVATPFNSFVVVVVVVVSVRAKKIGRTNPTSRQTFFKFLTITFQRMTRRNAKHEVQVRSIVSSNNESSAAKQPTHLLVQAAGH